MFHRIQKIVWKPVIPSLLKNFIEIIRECNYIVVGSNIKYNIGNKNYKNILV